MHNLDIKFGVRAVNKATGEKFEEVEMKRVEAIDGDQTGFIATEPNHTCEETLRKILSAKRVLRIRYLFQTRWFSITATATSKARRSRSLLSQLHRCLRSKKVVVKR